MNRVPYPLPMRLIPVLLLCLAPLHAASCDSTPEAQDTPLRPPNVVIVFTDDQGWADIGVQGAVGFETPNLDRLAGDGVRFTDFYVSQPVCSASRPSRSRPGWMARWRRPAL